MLSLAIAILILGLIGATILRRHLHEAKLLRLREISHKERMASMEGETPATGTDAARIDALLADCDESHSGSGALSRASVHWIRLIALALGLTCLFGGMGTLPGLYYLSDPEASGMWPIGLIPIFIGTGLLMFVRLSREMAGKMGDPTESR